MVTRKMWDSKEWRRLVKEVKMSVKLMSGSEVTRPIFEAEKGKELKSTNVILSRM